MAVLLASGGPCLCVCVCVRARVRACVRGGRTAFSDFVGPSLSGLKFRYRRSDMLRARARASAPESLRVRLCMLPAQHPTAPQVRHAARARARACRRSARARACGRRSIPRRRRPNTPCPPSCISPHPPRGQGRAPGRRRPPAPCPRGRPRSRRPLWEGRPGLGRSCGAGGGRGSLVGGLEVLPEGQQERDCRRSAAAAAAAAGAGGQEGTARTSLPPALRGGGLNCFERAI